MPAEDGHARIRQLIADQVKAVCALELDAIMEPYAPDVVLFDVKPPFRLAGAD
jgi:ketosteroid isomerase-like protein